MIKKPSIVYDHLPESIITEAPNETGNDTNTNAANVGNVDFNQPQTQQELGQAFGEPTNFSDIDLNSEPNFTLTEIGKIYALKRIYSTLNSLNSYIGRLISEDPNVKYIKLQEQINQLEDLLTLVTDNLDKYVKKLDKIIDLMEKFIHVIVNELQKVSEDTNDDNKN